MSDQVAAAAASSSVEKAAADSAVSATSVRLGTVTAVSVYPNPSGVGANVISTYVRLDGDVEAIPVGNLTGKWLAVGMRAVVEFVAPRGAWIVGSPLPDPGVSFSAGALNVNNSSFAAVSTTAGSNQFWNYMASTGVLRAPYPGWYKLDGILTWASSYNNYRLLAIDSFNSAGSLQSVWFASDLISSNSGQPFAQPFRVYSYLNAGDYFVLYPWQNTGSNLQVNNVYGTFRLDTQLQVA